MGVLTTCYSVSADLMKKIRRNNDNLADLLGLNDESDPNWKVADFEFDKGFEETIGLLRAAGFRKTYYYLDGERYFYSKTASYLEYEGYGIWIVPPSKTKIIVRELEPATFEKIKKIGLARQATDYYGQVIPEGDYEYYVGRIDRLKQFFKESSEQGHYLLFAQA